MAERIPALLMLERNVDLDLQAGGQRRQCLTALDLCKWRSVRDGYTIEGIYLYSGSATCTFQQSTDPGVRYPRDGKPQKRTFTTS